MIPDSQLIHYKNIHIAPCLRQRLEFAEQIRLLFLQHDYDCLILTLPGPAKKDIIEAIKLFPGVGVIAMEEKHLDQFSILPMDPSDAMIQSIFHALKLEIPIEFIDDYFYHPDNNRRLDVDDSLLPKLGFPRFLELYGSNVDRGKLSLGHYQQAQSLKKLSKQYKKPLFIPLLSEWGSIHHCLKHTPVEMDDPGLYLPDKISIYQASGSSIRFVSTEIPYIISQYVFHLLEQKKERFDRMKAIENMVYEAVMQFEAGLSSRSIRYFIHYAKSLSHEKACLVPDLSTLVRAASECIHEEFAVFLYRIGSRYYHKSKNQKIGTIELNSHNVISTEGESGNLPQDLPLPDYLPLGRKLRRERFFNQFELYPGAKVLERTKKLENQATDILSLFRETSRSRERNKQRPHGFAVWPRRLRKTNNSQPHEEIAPILFLFDLEKPSLYPWKAFLPSRQHDDNTIAFIANHPGLEQAFIRRKNLYFGSLLLYPEGHKAVNPFEGNKYKQNLGYGALVDRLIFQIIERNPYGKAHVFSHVSLNESVWAMANRKNIEIKLHPLAEVPRDRYLWIKKVNALGYNRLIRLFNRRRQLE